ncbi:MAG: (Na+)-NQR maturation NqrM [Endozoicomonas sp.]
MTMIVITFCVFLILIAAMSVGVVFANKPIKGSCGGLSNLGLKDDCVICGRGNNMDPLSEMNEDLFYDAAAGNSKQA